MAGRWGPMSGSSVDWTAASKAGLKDHRSVGLLVARRAALSVALSAGRSEYPSAGLTAVKKAGLLVGR
jgi:hypothetical protein